MTTVITTREATNRQPPSYTLATKSSARKNYASNHEYPGELRPSIKLNISRNGIKELQVPTSRLPRLRPTILALSKNRRRSAAPDMSPSVGRRAPKPLSNYSRIAAAKPSTISKPLVSHPKAYQPRGGHSIQPVPKADLKSTLPTKATPSADVSQTTRSAENRTPSKLLGVADKSLYSRHSMTPTTIKNALKQSGVAITTGKRAAPRCSIRLARVRLEKVDRTDESRIMRQSPEKQTGPGHGGHTGSPSIQFLAGGTTPAFGFPVAAANNTQTHTTDLPRGAKGKGKQAAGEDMSPGRSAAAGYPSAPKHHCTDSQAGEYINTTEEDQYSYAVQLSSTAAHDSLRTGGPSTLSSYASSSVHKPGMSNGSSDAKSSTEPHCSSPETVELATTLNSGASGKGTTSNTSKLARRTTTEVASQSKHEFKKVSSRVPRLNLRRPTVRHKGATVTGEGNCRRVEKEASVKPTVLPKLGRNGLNSGAKSTTTIVTGRLDARTLHHH